MSNTIEMNRLCFMDANGIGDDLVVTAAVQDKIIVVDNVGNSI